MNKYRVRGALIEETTFDIEVEAATSFEAEELARFDALEDVGTPRSEFVTVEVDTVDQITGVSDEKQYLYGAIDREMDEEFDVGGEG